MKKVILLFLLPVILLSGWKGNPRQRSAGLSKIKLYEYKQLDGNRINCTISSDGPYADYRKTFQAGMEWPKGSGKTCVFSAGIWIGGLHRPTDSLRMARVEFFSDFQPGPLLETFNTTTNDDTLAVNRAILQRYRLFKINSSDTLQGTANPDYLEWPGDLGAPYVDINNNGIWDSGIDKPKFFGDQQIWSVVNDASNAKHKVLSATKPMGVEVQSLFYVLNDERELGDMMFIRWKIINRSDADYDSVYIGMWSDPDLGYPADDLPGCDTLLSLGYVYNGYDKEYVSYGYGSQPPAEGWVLFKGPTVAGNLNDSAYIEGKWHKGLINLTPSSFIVTTKGTFPQIGDIPDGTPETAPIAYDFLKGMAGTAHQYIYDTYSGKPIKFWFAGNPFFPAHPTNPLPSNFPLGVFNPQEIRISLNTGPFTLAKGDTQTILAAFIIAQGQDRLGSIKRLKDIVSNVKKTVEPNFIVFPQVYTEVVNRRDSSEIRVQCFIQRYLPLSFVSYLRDTKDSLIARLHLYDDGLHCDSLPYDGILGNSVVISNIAEPLHLDLELFDNGNLVSKWRNIVTEINTARLFIKEGRIVSDSYNHDLQANPGENVRYVITVQNPNNCIVSGIWIIPTKDPDNKRIYIVDINPGELFSLSYDPSQPLTYYSFDVPPDYSQQVFEISLIFTNYKGNEWIDTLRFPVEPLIRRYAVMNDIGGDKLEGTFDILITEPSKVKDHLYVIRGIDSIDSQGTLGYSLKDSTENKYVFTKSPLPPRIPDHNSVPIDGFLILKGGVEYEIRGKGVTFEPNVTPWFTVPIGVTPDIPEAGIFLGFHCPITTIHSNLQKSDIHKVRVKFAGKSGYIDANGNGKYDINEKYFYDSTNSTVSQKAFFYSTRWGFIPPIFEGFLPVPFTIYDIEDNQAKQLTVAILDEDKNGQWDIYPNTIGAKKNLVFITNVQYDSTGSSYDSTNAGTIGLLNPTENPKLPLMWVLLTAFRSNYEPYSSEISMTFEATHPFSSASVLTFNPTNVVGVEKSTLPKEFILYQNYPNPFNPTTVISYSLLAVRDVSLKVFDVLGREIVTLVNERQKEGEYAAKWDATGFASGIYFYQLRAGEFVQTRKMILVR